MKQINIVKIRAHFFIHFVRLKTNSIPKSVKKEKK